MKGTVGILTVRRSVTMPKIVSGINVLALIEVGGQIFNKDATYTKIFEFGIPQLKEFLKKEAIEKGGITEKDFDNMLNDETEKMQKELHKTTREIRLVVGSETKRERKHKQQKANN